MHPGSTSEVQKKPIEQEIEDNTDLVSLIKSAKRDQSAFYPIYLQFVERVYHYILSRVGSHQDAEDLSSEVFVRAIKQINRFDERNSLAAWIFKIARNLTIDHYRSQRNASLELLEDDLPAAEKTSDLDAAFELNKQLARLDAAEIDLLALRYTARLSFVEIGQLLGKKPDAVRKAHNKVLDHLRLKME